MNKNEPAPGVHFDQLSVRFAEQPLFENLSFSIEAGHWTCLLGASGIGKSTLARLVIGIETGATVSGSVRIGSEPGTRHDVAWMAQDDLLYPWSNVLDNVMLGARLRGDSQGARPRALALIRDVGLSGSEYKFPHALSGGMRQRVALARTLMEDSAVVVLDEPFGSLDAVTRATLQELAFELLKARTVLLITHDPLEALRLGHSVLVLAGRPASLQPPIVPDVQPPRAVDSQGMASMHATLLDALASDIAG